MNTIKQTIAAAMLLLSAAWGSMMGQNFTQFYNYTSSIEANALTEGYALIIKDGNITKYMTTDIAGEPVLNTTLSTCEPTICVAVALQEGGFMRLENGRNMILTRLDNYGSKIWVKELPVHANTPTALIQLPNNKGFAGSVIQPDGQHIVFVADANGMLRWTRPSAKLPILASCTDGSFLVANGEIQKIDAASGKTLWASDNKEDILSMCATPQGGCMIATLLADHSIKLTNVATDGTQNWVSNLAPNNDPYQVVDMCAAADGRFAIAVVNAPAYQLPNSDLMVFDAKGKLTTTTRYAHILSTVAPATDKGWVATGTGTDPFGTSQVVLLKTDANGIAPEFEMPFDIEFGAPEQPKLKTTEIVPIELLNLPTKSDKLDKLDKK